MARAATVGATAAGDGLAVVWLNSSGSDLLLLTLSWGVAAPLSQGKEEDGVDRGQETCPNEPQAHWQQAGTLPYR